MKFIKLPRYRIFDYKPRFYNPEKEARDKKRKVSSIGMSAGFADARRRRVSAQKRYNFRIISIIGLLALLAYLILMY